ncbi:MAG: citrate/2-methylcitrate synthase [Acidobacteriota bacterium]
MPQDPSPEDTRAAGLEGIVVADSSICFIDGRKGQLVYRGYDIDDLADSASYEETAYLLWHGELPGSSQVDELRSSLASSRVLPDAIEQMLRTVRGAGAMATLRTATSLLSTFDPDTNDPSPAANRRKASRLTSAMATVLAHETRLSHGKEPVAPRPSLGHAANFLYMLNREEPGETAVKSFNTALVLHAEHGFNASTFAARITTATLSDMHSAVVSAIGTLKGPLHGGANRAVMKMLEEIGNVEAVEAAIKDRLARREKIMGFGHRVYKTMDPRARHLKKMAAALAAESGDARWYEMSARMEEVVMNEKGLFPNVDFYSASAYRAMGIPAEIYPAVFACSRIAGWTAHVMEQQADNRLIRPRARYIGPRNRTFRPLAERN